MRRRRPNPKHKAEAKRRMAGPAGNIGKRLTRGQYDAEHERQNPGALVSVTPRVLIPRQKRYPVARRYDA